MDFIANRTGDNIGMSYTLSRYTVRLSMTCVCVCICSVLRAQNVVVDEVEEYVFPEEMEIEGFNLTNGSAASISVPQLLLQNRSIGKANNQNYNISCESYAGSSVGVASVLFRNLQAFLPNDSYVAPTDNLHTTLYAIYVIS